MNESYLIAMNTLKWLPYHQGISVSVDQNISLMWLKWNQFEWDLLVLEGILSIISVCSIHSGNIIISY